MLGRCSWADLLLHLFASRTASTTVFCKRPDTILDGAFDSCEKESKALLLLLLLLLKILVCRLALVEAAMEELSEAHSECCLEVQRMLQLHNDYLANSDAPDICYLCREEGNSTAMHMSNDI